MPIIRRDDDNRKVFKKIAVSEDLEDYIGQAGDGSPGPPGAAGATGIDGVPGPDGSPGFGASLISNPSFENFDSGTLAPDDWSDDGGTVDFTSTDTAYLDGDYSLLIQPVATGSEYLFSKAFRVQPSSEYIITFFGMQTSDAGAVLLYINSSDSYPAGGYVTPAETITQVAPIVSGVVGTYNYGNILNKTSVTPDNADWGWYTAKFTTDATNISWISLCFLIAGYPASAKVWMDDVDCRRKLNNDDLITDIDLTFPNINNSLDALDADVLGLNTNFGILESNVITISGSVDELNSGFTNLEGNIATISGSVDGLTSSFNDLEGNVATISGSVDGLTSSFNDLEGNVATISGSVDGLTSSFNDLEGNVATISGSVDGLTSNFNDLEGNVATISGSVDGLTSNFNDLEGNVATISGSVDGLTSNFNDLEGNVATISGSVDGLTSNFESLEGNVTIISGSVSTIGDTLEGKFLFTEQTGFDTFGRKGLQRSNLVINGDLREENTDNWECIPDKVGTFTYKAKSVEAVPTTSLCPGSIYNSKTDSVGTTTLSSYYIPVDITHTYSLTGYIKFEVTSLLTAVGVRCYDENKIAISPTPERYIGLRLYNNTGAVAAAEWVKFPLEGTVADIGNTIGNIQTGYIAGSGTGDNEFPVGTKYIRIIIVGNMGGGGLSYDYLFTDIKFIDNTSNNFLESDGSVNFSFNDSASNSTLLGANWTDSNVLTVGVSYTDPALSGWSGPEIADMLPLMQSDLKDEWPNSGAGENECCLLAGTRIQMASGKKKIEDIEIGDEVVSYNIKENKLSISVVKELESPTRNGYFILNKGLLKITNEHPLYITNKKDWVKVEDLEIGDKIYMVGGDKIAIDSIQYVDRRTQTYNIKWAEGDNNFFANGCLAHNKHPGVSNG